MEKAEISRLINSFNAIKGYFDTTKRYMPQIAKLVFFIEEIVPLLNTIHSSLNQSSSLIPAAAEKLGKVTSATEMAATEVMDIVDNVISRLNTMTSVLDELDGDVTKGIDESSLKQKTQLIREEIDGSQEDLFSIMNALQFQDITTQQINSIASTIDNVNRKLSELLNGFEDDSIDFLALEETAFDPNAEYDFERSAASQRMADEFLKMGTETINTDEEKGDDLAKQQSSDSPGTMEAKDEPVSNEIDAEITYGEDGQPDISSIVNKLNETE